ncbi:MAG: TonB-dependent receptor [Erythrobacter sp.]
MTVTSQAQAQDAQGPEIEQGSSDGIPEILVTARKRVEPLQSTPVAVTALGGEALERIQATDLSDLSGRAPNVTINTIGNFGSSVSVFIRGIGNGDPGSTVDPAVGIYVDGVYLPRTVNSSLDLFDVEQVEVLRGPQGTLFGRNTTAGAINYRTKRPTGESAARGTITLGSFGQRDLRISAETPLIEDVLAVKVSAFSQEHDGFFTNTFVGGPGARAPRDAGRTSTFSLRPTVLFTPTDNFELTLIGEYYNENSDNLPTINISQPGQLLQVFHSPPVFEAGAEVRAFPFNVEGFSDIEVFGLTAEANWEIGPGTATLVSNYRDTTDFNNNDTDGTPASFFETLRETPHEQFSSELRYDWELNDNINVIAGVFYFRQKFFLQRDTFLDITNTGTATELRSQGGQTHRNYAAFAQIDYDVTDRLSISLGGRYTYEEKDFFSSLFRPVALGLSPRINLSDTWSNFGPKVGFDYRLTDDALVYGSYSKGFKSGGFSVRGSTATALGPFDEESVDAFEIGLKADWFDNRLRTNIAIFQSNYSDLQRTVIRSSTDPNNPQETITDNAANATVKGIEMEVTAVPVDGLQLDFSMGYIDAKYDEFLADLNNDGIVTDNSDLPLSRAPKWTLGAGASYRADLGSAGELTLRGDWIYVDNQNVLANGAAIGEIPSYNVLDASIRWDLPDDRFHVTVFAKNVNDEIFVSSLTNVAALFNFNQISPPRRYGVTFGFDL